MDALLKLPLHLGIQLVAQFEAHGEKNKDVGQGIVQLAELGEEFEPVILVVKQIAAAFHLVKGKEEDFAALFGCKALGHFRRKEANQYFDGVHDLVIAIDGFIDPQLLQKI